MNLSNISPRTLFPSFGKEFTKIRAISLVGLILFSLLLSGCINPLQFVPLDEPLLDVNSPGGSLNAAYPPLASLTPTAYEGALGLEWNWPQEAQIGDKAVFDYAPNTTSIASRAVVGNPAGNTPDTPVTIEYPQTATVITGLTSGAEYVVKGYVKYDSADGRYSVDNEKRIRVEAIVTINPTEITSVDFRDLVKPASYTEPKYIILDKNNSGVFAEVRWTVGITDENVWDPDRVNPEVSDGRFGRVIYAPRARPKATITLYTFNSSIKLANTVTVLGFGSYGISATKAAGYAFDYEWPSSTGSATGFYVKADGGSDYNPGTQASPMYTLNGALQRVAAERAAGYTSQIRITVDGGVGDYYERHSAPNSGTFINISGLSVQIRGINNAVIRANGDIGTELRIFKLIDATVELQDIEITGGKITIGPHDPDTDLGGAGIYLAGSTANSGSYLSLINVYLHGNIVQNASGGGGIMAVGPATSVRIQNSVISDNTVTAVSNGGLGGGGILLTKKAHLYLNGGAVVENNTAYGRSDGSDPALTSGGGIKAMYGGRIDMGLEFPYSPLPVVRGNTADRTNGGGIALYEKDGIIQSLLEMYDGRIYANQVVNTRPVSLDMGGGGVYLGAGSGATMWDGIIGGDTTGYTFNGLFSSISNPPAGYPPEGNKADVNGGGVFIETGALKFNMEGGEISYNSALVSRLYIGEEGLTLRWSSRGGGVFVNDIDIPWTGTPTFGMSQWTRFSMTGANKPAIIKSNFAGYGGGIYTRGVIWIRPTYWEQSVGAPSEYGAAKVIENFALTESEAESAENVRGYNIHAWYYDYGDPEHSLVDVSFYGYDNHYKFGAWTYDPDDLRWDAWDRFANDDNYGTPWVADAFLYPGIDAPFDRSDQSAAVESNEEPLL